MAILREREQRFVETLLTVHSANAARDQSGQATGFLSRLLKDYHRIVHPDHKKHRQKVAAHGAKVLSRYEGKALRFSMQGDRVVMSKEDADGHDAS